MRREERAPDYQTPQNLLKDMLLGAVGHLRERILLLPGIECGVQRWSFQAVEDLVLGFGLDDRSNQVLHVEILIDVSQERTLHELDCR